MSEEYKGGGLLGLLGDVGNTVRTFGKAVKATRGGSLSEFLGSTAVEPVCLVEQSLTHNEIMPNLLNNLLESYSCMYIMVATRKTALDINAVRVTRTLEALATDRDILDTLAAVESEKIKDRSKAGHMLDDAILKFNKKLEESVGLEFKQRKVGKKPTEDKDNKDSDRSRRDSGSRYNHDERARYGTHNDNEIEGGMSINDRMFSPVTDNQKLSVGKLIKLTITSGKSRMDVAVAIRFKTKNVPSQLINDIFVANYADHDILTRIKMYNLEEITFKEALTGSHFVAAQERVRVADKDGVIKSHFVDSMKNATFAVLTGEIPINRASGITIVNSRTIPMIEREIKGKITKHKDRMKFFTGTATMVLAVVDEENEVVDIYYRGFDEGISETFRSLNKSSGGKSNGDLTPVVKDLLQGQMPSL